MNNQELNLESSFDEIFEIIGLNLSGEQAFPKTKKELIELGERWYKLNNDKLKERICNNDKIMGLAKDEGNEKSLIAAVADVVSTILINVPPFTISLLIVKYGVHKLCDVK